LDKRVSDYDFDELHQDPAELVDVDLRPSALLDDERRLIARDLWLARDKRGAKPAVARRELAGGLGARR
jgi:hypothetical protein